MSGRPAHPDRPRPATIRNVGRVNEDGRRCMNSPGPDTEAVLHVEEQGYRRHLTARGSS